MKRFVLAISIMVIFVVALTAIAIWGASGTDARLHEDGYRAGRDGIPVEACPYNYRDGTVWKQGWIVGRSAK